MAGKGNFDDGEDKYILALTPGGHNACMRVHVQQK